MSLIELKDITKVYKMKGGEEIKALRGINLSIEAGEFVAIMGPSGSGKSTLLNIIGCLDTPNSGVYKIEGKEVSQLDDDALSKIRNEKIGFVFQVFNLLPGLTALENVMIPFLYNPKVNLKEAREKAYSALTKVGIFHRANHKPAELSGGEQQRVAIARAIATEPTIILADELTGNLDSATGETIMHLLKELNEGDGRTIMVVTHNEKVASFAKRVLRLIDGELKC